MTDVLMPRLSDSMQEGTILTWLAADGDDVVEGQELVDRLLAKDPAHRFAGSPLPAPGPRDRPAARRPGRRCRP